MASDEAVSVVVAVEEAAVVVAACDRGSFSGSGAAKETFFVLVELVDGSCLVSSVVRGVSVGCSGCSVGKSCSLLPWSMLDRRRSFCSSAGLRLDMSS